MIIFTILFSVVAYIVAAGATHGYSKYRWPPKMVSRLDNYYNSYNADENEGRRIVATVFWPFYWVFVWPFTKINEVTFSNIEKNAALQVAKNKARIEELQITRAEVEKSNAELERAEVELENEIGKL